MRSKCLVQATCLLVAAAIFLASSQVHGQLTDSLLQQAYALCGPANYSLVSVCNTTAFAYPSGTEDTLTTQHTCYLPDVIFDCCTGCLRRDASSQLCSFPLPGYNCSRRTLSNGQPITCLLPLTCPPYPPVENGMVSTGTSRVRAENLSLGLHSLLSLSNFRRPFIHHH
jgi:hypothetical protein